MTHRLPRALMTLALALLTGSARGDAPPRAPRPGVEAILGQLLSDNARFVAHTSSSYFAQFTEAQHPRATVLACADARFHAHSIDHAADNDLYVVRNMGNQLGSNSGSVEYGVRHLRTPLLLVVGHVRCGAIHEAMEDYTDRSGAVRRELDGLHLAIFRTHAAGSEEQRWLANVIGNVNQQVRAALQEYQDLVKGGALHVVGAIYDFRDDLGHGKGRLVLINLDGEISPERIRGSPLLKSVRGVLAAGAAPRGR